MDVNYTIYLYGEKCPLDSAIRQANVDMVRLLIKSGADVNYPFINDSSFLVNYSSKYTGMGADQTKQNEILKELINAGADLNTLNQSGEAPITIASSQNNFELVRMLTEAGANIDIAEKNSNNALTIAFENQNEEIINYLLDNGADSKNDYLDKDGESILFYAAHLGDLDILSKVVKRGANLNIRNVRQQTAALQMIMGISSDRNEVLKFLVDNGAEMNGYNAIYFFTDNNNDDFLFYLIDKGLDINCTADGHWSALMYAVRNGNIERVDRMLEKGVNVNYQSELDKSTAIMIAAMCGETEIVKLLLAAGADVTARDAGGRNALDYAQDPYEFADHVFETGTPEIREILKSLAAQE
jgi:ankyrin repeat protein